MKTVIPLDYVAMLGRRASNRQLQLKISRYIFLEAIRLGYGVCYGNITGSFGCMSKTLSLHGGITRLITADEVPTNSSLCCDVLEIVNAQSKKHELISNASIGAIILSNDRGTKKIISQFLSRDKPVIAIKDLVETDNFPTGTIIISNYKTAISQLISQTNRINFSSPGFSYKA